VIYDSLSGRLNWYEGPRRRRIRPLPQSGERRSTREYLEKLKSGSHYEKGWRGLLQISGKAPDHRRCDPGGSERTEEKDFVIVRSDGNRVSPGEWSMTSRCGSTHVIRAEDHLSEHEQAHGIFMPRPPWRLRPTFR